MNLIKITAILCLLSFFYAGNLSAQSKKVQITTLINQVDSFRLALSNETQVKLENEKNNALKIEKCKSEVEEKALVIDKLVNESEVLKQANERLTKRIIDDSLKNNEKKENPTNKLNVGLCYSNHKTDEYQKYVLIQINNRLYELSVNGYPYTVTCDPDDFGGLEITSNSEDLSSFCESYGIKNSKMVKQLLKVNFQGENFRIFWAFDESTNKIEVGSIIEGEGRDGKIKQIGTFPYNPE
jgi:hypothetical protein